MTNLCVFENLRSLAELTAFVLEEKNRSLFAVRGDDVLITVVIDVRKDRGLTI